MAKRAAVKKAAAKKTASKAAPVRKLVASTARAKVAKRARPPAVSSRTAELSAGNVGVACSAEQDGSLVVAVAYEGPLATREAVSARAGALRQGGGPWGETVDLDLEPDGEGRWVGHLTLSSGEPIHAVQLVFHASGEWDNGGRAPLGYYEWILERETLEIR